LIGGVSALSYFLSGSGREWSSFRFVGFLPARKSERLRLFKEVIPEPLLFFESPHRLQSTLELLAQTKPEARLILAKELSKWAENFFEGKACELLSSISSFKGEWVGCIVSEKD
jgi:16S rRNA (cytidine1402-2'-O)-methyltransferase